MRLPAYHVKVEIILKQVDIIMHFIQDHFQKGIYFSTSIFLAGRYCKLLIYSVQKVVSKGGQPFFFLNLTEAHNGLLIFKWYTKLK